MKAGLGAILGLFVQIVYLATARVGFSVGILGVSIFLVSGFFLLFGGFRLLWGAIYGRETYYLLGLGKSGEDLLAGLILLIISLVMMSVTDNRTIIIQPWTLLF